MTRRFFAADIAGPGRVRLDDTEAHHAATVLRLQPGTAIELFDGRGRWATATLTSVHKRGVEVDVERVEQAAWTGCLLTVAVAVPKGERFDWLIEKLTELGVMRIVPLRTDNGVVDPRATKLDRLRQLIISAGKQSRRHWLPELADVTDLPGLWAGDVSAALARSPSATLLAPSATALDDTLPGIAAQNSRPLWWVLDPTGAAWGAIASPRLQRGPRSLTLVIGPEGGWTDAERAWLADQEIERVALPTPILRIETAAIAAAAAVLCGWLEPSYAPAASAASVAATE